MTLKDSKKGKDAIIAQTNI